MKKLSANSQCIPPASGAGAPWIFISIRSQQLFLRTSQAVFQIYRISTGKNPPSNLLDSFGTPRGWHEVGEKIGQHLVAGEVLVGRRPIGKTFSELPDSGGQLLITSRILRLRGLQPGINAGTTLAGECCDSEARYIYIHGTNREEAVGQPFSHGCVLLRNDEMIALFESVPLGTRVLIH